MELSNTTAASRQSRGVHAMVSGGASTRSVRFVRMEVLFSDDAMLMGHAWFVPSAKKIQHHEMLSSQHCAVE
jgi:hypothetical protein